MVNAHISDRFTLLLEENFVDTLSAFLDEKEDEIKDKIALSDIRINIENTGKLGFMPLKRMLASMYYDGCNEVKIRLTGPPLRPGELISLTYSKLGDVSILQAYFNQFNPNNLYKSAWAYISDNPCERHGVMLIEHKRELEKDLIEFCSFLYNTSQDEVRQFAHVITETEEKHRRDVMIEGFVGFRQIMEALAGHEIQLSADRVEVLFESIVQPIYESFHRKMVSRARETSKNYNDGKVYESCPIE